MIWRRSSRALCTDSGATGGGWPFTGPAGALLAGVPLAVAPPVGPAAGALTPPVGPAPGSVPCTPGAAVGRAPSGPQPSRIARTATARISAAPTARAIRPRHHGRAY